MTRPANIVFESEEGENEGESDNPFSFLIQAFKDENPNAEKAKPTYTDIDTVLEKTAEETDFLS